MTLVADPTEPLVLADGTKIDPTTGEVLKEKRSRQLVEVPSNSEAQKIVARTRRSIAELPMPPQQLTGVALVAFYTLFGLSDQDIAIACDSRLTVEQIERIRELDAYKEFMDNAKKTIVESSTDRVRDLFTQHAETAAQNVISLIESDNDVLSFKASQDVLDRAGHRPADVVEHRHAMEGALNIIITKRDPNAEMPVIDIKPSEVSYENDC